MTENEKKMKKEITLLEIKSFEELYESLINGNYNIKKLEQDFQNFCIESEKNNYLCEKNEINKILLNKKTLFDKFIFNKNRFDFQLSMSELILKFFNFVNNVKPNDKKEYNLINNIYDIFTEIKSNNLIMTDIECLIENGVFNYYHNNFFIFLFDKSDKFFKKIFYFFDIKKYFLSNVENINIFITNLNQLIISYTENKKQFLFVRKIGTLIIEIFSLFDNNNINNNEEKNKIKKYKEKIETLINKEKIFEIFFNDIDFISHMDILLNIFKIFPKEVDKQINILIKKNDKQITKSIMKFIIKNCNELKNYINNSTLNILNNISIENSFKFHLLQYENGKDRLINIYTKFKSNENIIKLLINFLNEKNKKKQAELIEQKNYNEKDEYELEEKFIEKNNINKYFTLPNEYKIYFISGENDESINKSLNILNNILINNLNTDEYMGIDSEWKSSQTFLEQFNDNLGSNKNYIEFLADIIQIAGINYGFIFDVKSIYKNEEIKQKLKKIFFNTKFIGFGFKSDCLKLGDFFKEIIFKNKFIELGDIDKQKKNKKTPELKIIISEFFGKELDKRDQISDWTKRPLLQNQINYGILDAYVLILMFQKLNDI